MAEIILLQVLPDILDGIHSGEYGGKCSRLMLLGTCSRPPS